MVAMWGLTSFMKNKRNTDKAMHRQTTEKALLTISKNNFD
jgi:hypothetical protein